MAGNADLPLVANGFGNAAPTNHSVRRPAAALIATGNTDVADPAQIRDKPDHRGRPEALGSLDGGETLLIGDLLGGRDGSASCPVVRITDDDPGAVWAAGNMVIAPEHQRLRLVVRLGHGGHQDGPGPGRDRGRVRGDLDGGIRREPPIHLRWSRRRRGGGGRKAGEQGRCEDEARTAAAGPG